VRDNAGLVTPPNGEAAGELHEQGAQQLAFEHRRSSAVESGARSTRVPAASTPEARNGTLGARQLLVTLGSRAKTSRREVTRPKGGQLNWLALEAPG